jgi:hypothetical protein
VIFLWLELEIHNFVPMSVVTDDDGVHGHPLALGLPERAHYKMPLKGYRG